MVINLITFASLLHKQASVRSSHEIILTELEKYFTVNFIDYQDINKLTPDDFSILFIATGGVERLVIQHFESLPRPAIILAARHAELTRRRPRNIFLLRGRGMKSEILHGELSEIIKRIFVLHSNFMAQRSLFGMRIGVIGAPSGWLIASNVDYLLAKRRWGVEYTDVALDRIYEYYAQITDDEVGEACARLAGKSACLPGSVPRRYDKGDAPVPGYPKDCGRRPLKRAHPELLPPDRADGHYRMPGAFPAERRGYHRRMRR